MKLTNYNEPRTVCVLSDFVDSTVTFGKSSHEQQEKCWNKYTPNGNDNLKLNKDFFLGERIYELWVKEELSGLLKLSITTDQDEDDIDEFKVYIVVTGVLVINKKQGFGFSTGMACAVTVDIIRHINPEYHKNLEITISALCCSQRSEAFIQNFASYLEEFCSSVVIETEC